MMATVPAELNCLYSKIKLPRHWPFSFGPDFGFRELKFVTSTTAVDIQPLLTFTGAYDNWRRRYLGALALWY